MAEAMKKMWVVRHMHDKGERRWDEFVSRLLPVLCLKVLKGHIIFKRIHFLSHILLFPTAATPLSSQLQANHSLFTTSKIPAYFLCKTQNSGLRSKEEKPRDPINQPSRCNTQECLLTVAQTGWLWSPGRQSTPNSKLGKLLWAKKPHYQHITYGLQSDWLHVCKAILSVQTSRAFVQT